MTVSTTGVDGGAAEVRFLENLQLVLAESQTSSTYKYALLIALADLCIEDARPDGEAELTIPIARIAEKFLELYWGHGRPYGTGLPGTSTRALLQNRGKQAAVVTTADSLREAFGSPTRARNDRRWQREVARLTRHLKEMPLWRLQRLRTTTLDFLYPANPGGDSITLRPGVATYFRRFHTLIVRLVQAEWMAFLYEVPGNAEVLGSAGDLANFLFGPQRESLAKARPRLHDLQHGRCFYCTDALRGPGEVDHFIPWSRYPRNLVHNLVVAHRACNGAKSDVLAGPEHRERWSAHVVNNDTVLCDIGASSGLMADRAAALHIADWSYTEARRVHADVWIIGNQYQPLV